MTDDLRDGSDARPKPLLNYAATSHEQAGSRWVDVAFWVVAVPTTALLGVMLAGLVITLLS